MLRALANATADLFRPPVPRLLAIAGTLGIAAFVALWFGLDALVACFVGDDGALPAALSWLGAAATIVLAWLLFPVVAIAILCLFLERTAGAIERRHFPDLPPAAGQPFWTSLGAAVQFLGAMLLANALLLLVLLFAAPAYPIAWLLTNGWLLGREYFELTALRRLRVAEARALRAAHGIELLGLGCLFAGLLAVPIVNFVVPVWATAVLVHRTAAWQHAPPR